MTSAFGIKHRIQKASTHLLTQLPSRLQRMVGGMPMTYQNHTLSPQLQLLHSMFEPADLAVGLVGALKDRRTYFSQLMSLLSGHALDIYQVQDISLPCPSRTIAARFYQPFDSAEPLPTMLYVHGGGLVMGDLDTHDSICRLLCAHAGIQVISIEYRLAPEHTIDAAMTDVLEAWQTLQQHPELFHADPHYWMIGGDGAGATLVLATMHDAVQHQQALPRLQVLLYPSTDHRQVWASHALYEHELFHLNHRPSVLAFFRQPFEVYDPRLSPLQHPMCVGMPKTLMVRAGFCPLRDEQAAYMQRLQSAGSPVLEMDFSHLTHGFAHLTGMSSDCYRAMVEIADQLATLINDSQIDPDPL